jgi:hypothetical protein
MHGAMHDAMHGAMHGTHGTKHGAMHDACPSRLFAWRHAWCQLFSFSQNHHGAMHGSFIGCSCTERRIFVGLFFKQKSLSTQKFEQQPRKQSRHKVKRTRRRQRKKLQSLSIRFFALQTKLHFIFSCNCIYKIDCRK